MKYVLFFLLSLMARASIEREIEPQRDVRIPEVVVEEIHKAYAKVAFDKHDALAGHEGSEVVLPRRNLDLKVVLTEKTRGILNSSQIELKPPTGGGIIDLSQWVHRGRGTFFWNVELEPHLGEEGHGAAVNKVYFLSQHPRRQRKDGPAIGMGCSKVVDITKHFETVIEKPPGQKLNTTDGTHLGTLMGTYYFFVINKEAVRVATLTFNDSRFPDAHCTEPTTSDESQ